MNATLYLGLDGGVIPTAPSSAAGWAVEHWTLAFVDDAALSASADLVYRLNVLSGEPGVRVRYVAHDGPWALRAIDALGLRRGQVALSPDRVNPLARLQDGNARLDISADPNVGLTRWDLARLELALAPDTHRALA